MKKYFYKLNKRYLENFEKDVLSKYLSWNKRSVTSLLKAIFLTINELFGKLGGRISTKNDIPKADHYPDSSRINKLLMDIDTDLEKLYSAQKLVEDDINNLIKFNEVQRERAFENFTTIQHAVYSTYVESRKDIIGGIQVPADNPFTDSSSMGPESQNVAIDETRGTLTLAGQNTNVVRPIDIQHATIYMNIQGGMNADQQTIEELDGSNLYPNEATMGLSSHWKKHNPDPHFKNISNRDTEIEYRRMLIDDPTNPIGVGICEFEFVGTADYIPAKIEKIKHQKMFGNYQATWFDTVTIDEAYEPDTILKKYIGSSKFNKDPNLIYIDRANSLQGRYLGDISNIDKFNSFKIVMPFTSPPQTSEIMIDFSSNKGTYGFYPVIDWSKSVVFSGGTAYALIPPSPNFVSHDGRYKCLISRPVIPERIELVVNYNGGKGDIWPHIPFYMSRYVYSYKSSYVLPQPNTASSKNITVYLESELNIFVDTEANEQAEKQRAYKLLKGKV